MVLYGTCMGSANSHSNVNLPVLLAGGGFKHGQHLAFDPQNNYPLTNLYLSMLQRLGHRDRQHSRRPTGTMRGLETGVNLRLSASHDATALRTTRPALAAADALLCLTRPVVRRAEADASDVLRKRIATTATTPRRKKADLDLTALPVRSGRTPRTSPAG